MASHSYTIQVKNKWQRCRFSLSAEPLTEPAEEGSAQLFQLSPPVEAQADGSSTATFKIANTIFAVHGTSTNGNSSNISTQEFRKVKLGPEGSVVGITMQDDAVVWDDTSTKGQVTEQEGCFRFTVDSSVHNDGKNTVFIGTGLVDPDDSEQVVPFYVFHPKASANYIITSSMRFILTASHHERGDHTDFEASTYVVVDFGQCQVPKASVTINGEGHLIDDGGRSKQNGVRILPSKSSNIGSAIVEKVDE